VKTSGDEIQAYNMQQTTPKIRFEVPGALKLEARIWKWDCGGMGMAPNSVQEVYTMDKLVGAGEMVALTGMCSRHWNKLECCINLCVEQDCGGRGLYDLKD
jgi:hypothetical protein